MDFTTDPLSLHWLARLEEVTPLPDFVKAANAESLSAEAYKRMSIAMFADAVNRQYPVGTKMATYLSAAYLVTKAPGLKPTLWAKIARAADIHGIRAQVDLLETAFQTWTKSATAKDAPRVAAGDVYALWVAKSAGGKEMEGYYPINNAGALEKSARQLSTDRAVIPSNWFHYASQRLVKQARVLAVPENAIPESIIDAGQERVPNFNHARKIAQMRSYVVKDAEAVGLYENLVSSAEQDQGNVETYIRLWSALDATHGVPYHYMSKGARAAGILDPYEAFYAGPLVSELEEASKMSLTIKNASGKDLLVPLSAFSGLTQEVLNKYFLKAAAEDIGQAVRRAGLEKDARVLRDKIASLHPDEQQRILSLITAETLRKAS